MAPYRDDYKTVKGVPIVHAATAWQSPETGQTYILVLNESIWMGDAMESTLVNPNQLRHFGTRVQDNPASECPLSIITEGGDFCMGLDIEGTIVFANTHTPSNRELRECPHVELSSSHVWEPEKVRFQKISRSLKDEIGDVSKLILACCRLKISSP